MDIARAPIRAEMKVSKRRMVSFGCKMLLTDAPARGKVNNLGANLCVKGKLDFESGIKSTQL